MEVLLHNAQTLVCPNGVGIVKVFFRYLEKNDIDPNESSICFDGVGILGKNKPFLLKIQGEVPGHLVSIDNLSYRESSLGLCLMRTSFGDVRGLWLAT